MGGERKQSFHSKVNKQDTHDAEHTCNKESIKEQSAACMPSQLTQHLMFRKMTEEQTRANTKAQYGQHVGNMNVCLATRHQFV